MENITAYIYEDFHYNLYNNKMGGNVESGNNMGGVRGQFKTYNSLSERPESISMAEFLVLYLYIKLWVVSRVRALLSTFLFCLYVCMFDDVVYQAPPNISFTYIYVLLVVYICVWIKIQFSCKYCYKK